MRETGTVIKAEDDGALVVFARRKACKNCGMCMVKDNKMALLARNPVDARPGDEVEVQLETGVFLQAAFLAYVLPLAGLLAALAAANALGANELVQGVCALGAAAVALLAVRMAEDRRKSKTKYTPSITAIIDTKEK